MNGKRVAELLRELADAIEEDAPPSARPSAPDKPAKTRPLTDIDRARARKALRRLGVDVRG
jgi:hypothetical protein